MREQRSGIRDQRSEIRDCRLPISKLWLRARVGCGKVWAIELTCSGGLKGTGWGQSEKGQATGNGVLACAALPDFLSTVVPVNPDLERLETYPRRIRATGCI